MKFLPYNLSARHLAILGMSVVTLLLLLVGCLQWKSGNDFRISRERVTHTYVVRFDLESLLSSMLDAETGQRGYLLAHGDGYLEPYNHSLTLSHDQVKVLRQLITDPGQLARLDRLEYLMKVKFDESAQTVFLEQHGDHAGAMQLVTNNSGSNTMDQIRSLVQVMQDAEMSLFQQRENAYQRDSRINANLSALLIALGPGSIVGILFFSLLRRLARMQEMITICAWSKLIECDGEWLSIEEYLSRRLHARISHGISHVEAVKVLELLEYEKLKAAAQAR